MGSNYRDIVDHRQKRSAREHCQSGVYYKDRDQALWREITTDTPIDEIEVNQVVKRSLN